MNLLGMKRKLLPYGMPLGGAMGALGAFGGGGGQSAPTTSSGGGKSAPPTQNNYSPSFGSQSAAPTTSSAPSGGKSSGLGQGGYGGAPGFGGQQSNQMGGMGEGGAGGLSAFNGTFSPEALAFQQANPQNDAAATSAQNAITGMQGDIAKQTNNMQQNQGMPMQGGKSSGLGQGGYQSAPGFGQQQGSPAQQLGQLGNLLRGQQLGGLASQRGMQGGFGPQAPTQEAFNGFRAMTGSPMNFDQFSQSRGGGFNQQQRQQFQQPQGISGLQSLFNNMMGQQRMQQPMQQMPRFQSQALQYKPDYIRAQENLNRVKPSVQKQDQDAQAARIAELEAQLAGYQTPTGGGDAGGG